MPSLTASSEDEGAGGGGSDSDEMPPLADPDDGPPAPAVDVSDMPSLGSTEDENDDAENAAAGPLAAAATAKAAAGGAGGGGGGGSHPLPDADGGSESDGSSDGMPSLADSLERLRLEDPDLDDMPPLADGEGADGSDMDDMPPLAGSEASDSDDVHMPPLADDSDGPPPLNT